MSGSTTHLDVLSSSQSAKETAANTLFNAASPAMLFGKRDATTTGLTWGFYGGTMAASGSPYTILTVANGTVALTGSQTNYVQANPSSGAVTANTTGFTTGLIPLYTVVTSASGITSYTDSRAIQFATKT